MERIRYAAEISVRRGLGFAGLGIATLMMGLIFDPVLSLRVGAAAFLLTALALGAKGWWAPRRDYRKTEVWLLLDRDISLPPEVAQRVISTVLQELLYRHALLAAIASFACWVAAILLWVALRWV